MKVHLVIGAVFALSMQTAQAQWSHPDCAQLKACEVRLKHREAELRSAIGPDAAARGPAAKEAIENTAGAGVLLGLLNIEFNGEYVPLWTVWLARCDGAAQSNSDRTADCKQATHDVSYSGERLAGIGTRFSQAARRADTALGQMLRKSDDPAGKTLKAVQDDLKEAQRQVDACLAELKKPPRK